MRVNNNELKILAKAAGVKYVDIQGSLFVRGGCRIGDEIWRPNKDLDQAFRCLVDLSYTLHSPYYKSLGYGCSVSKCAIEIEHAKIYHTGDTQAIAICKSVLKYEKARGDGDGNRR